MLTLIILNLCLFRDISPFNPILSQSHPKQTFHKRLDLKRLSTFSFRLFFLFSLLFFTFPCQKIPVESCFKLSTQI